jgi:hypothetical protein
MWMVEQRQRAARNKQKQEKAVQQSRHGIYIASITFYSALLLDCIVYLLYFDCVHSLSQLNATGLDWTGLDWHKLETKRGEKGEEKGNNEAVDRIE